MVYQIERIIADVKALIDENAAANGWDSGDLAGEMPTLSINDTIRGLIEETAMEVELKAPLELLDDPHPFAEAWIIDSEGRGRVMLPEDIMRLVVFKMSDWRVPVYVMLMPGDVGYSAQDSPYPELRGTAERPVCRRVDTNAGGVLEFYACRSTEAEVESALYIPRPMIDHHGGIDLCKGCYRTIVSAIAAKVKSIN